MSGYPLIPASPMFLDHLLGLLFILHILFMNFVVAFPLLIAWFAWTKPTEGRLAVQWLAAALPAMFTFAINFGVASLLFVQVLYSDRFFTANIILGKIWLGVILMLLLSFYGAYLVKSLLKGDRGGMFGAGAVGMVIGAIVWGIALIMIANYFITTDILNWRVLLGHPAGVLRNATFLPRTLHFITGSFAVTGFWMVWISWWRGRRGAEDADVLSFRKKGLLLAAGATGLEITIGIWFLLWQPSETWDALFSGSLPSIVWISGVATGLAMLGFLIVAAVFPTKVTWQQVSTWLLVWTLIGMVAGRDLVRHTAFGPDYKLSTMAHTVQAKPMLLFFCAFLGGLGVLVWLFGLLWPRRASKSE